MQRESAHEASVALRGLIPFFRVVGPAPSDLNLLAREGLTFRDVVAPHTRIRQRAFDELLLALVSRAADPDLGLHAGERVLAGDFDAFEFAARSAATVRDSIECARRYLPLVHGAQEAELAEHGDLASVVWRVTDGVEPLRAANDFQVASTITLGRVYTNADPSALRQVHLRHEKPASIEAYQRLFPGVELSFGVKHNALVFARAQLETKMVHAHDALHAAYEQHAHEALARVARGEGIAGRVRGDMAEHLSRGDVGGDAIARRFGTTVRALRRQLSLEGTSLRELLDDVRRELLQQYLQNSHNTIADVAQQLGFLHVTGLYKAFGRWSETATPARLRRRLRRT